MSSGRGRGCLLAVGRPSWGSPASAAGTCRVGTKAVRQLSSQIFNAACGSVHATLRMRHVGTAVAPSRCRSLVVSSTTDMGEACGGRRIKSASFSNTDPYASIVGSSSTVFF